MSQLRFGFADTIITPELNGTFMDGYGFRISPATGIRSPLHAKVMAVCDEKDVFLLFNIDLIGLNERLYRLVSRQISAFTHVPVEHIALNFIHTHAAPAAGILDELPINYDYFGYVGDRCAEAANLAVSRAVPCTVCSEILPEQMIHAFNRRGRGVIDRSIRSTAFRDTEGNLRGVICSASCHAVVNTSMEISPDWLASLNEQSSDACPWLFFQGRCADINPYQDEGLDMDGFLTAVGRDLTEPVQRFINRAETGESPVGSLDCAYEWVTLPMKDQDRNTLEAEIAALRKEYAGKTGVDKHVRFREIRWREHMVEMIDKKEPFDITVPLQCMKLGNALLFCMVPFELLTLLGNKIEDLAAQAGWPRENIYVCGYSNAVYSYLPSEEEFEFGGYEVCGATHWYNLPECTPGTSKKMLSWFAKHIFRY